MTRRTERILDGKQAIDPFTTWAVAPLVPMLPPAALKLEKPWPSSKQVVMVLGLLCVTGAATTEALAGYLGATTRLVEEALLHLETLGYVTRNPK